MQGIQGIDGSTHEEMKRSFQQRVVPRSASQRGRVIHAEPLITLLDVLLCPQRAIYNVPIERLQLRHPSQTVSTKDLLYASDHRSEIRESSEESILIPTSSPSLTLDQICRQHGNHTLNVDPTLRSSLCHPLQPICSICGRNSGEMRHEITCSWESTVGSSASWPVFVSEAEAVESERGGRDFRSMMTAPSTRGWRGASYEKTMVGLPSAMCVKWRGPVPDVGAGGWHPMKQWQPARQPTIRRVIRGIWGSWTWVWKEMESRRSGENCWDSNSRCSWRERAEEMDCPGFSCTAGAGPG